jgi:hypothetical protein
VFRAGIYVGWVGYLNLGDEAMYELCRTRFSGIRWSRLEDVSYELHPGQIIRRGHQSPNQMLEAITEELSNQRRLRSLATKTLQKVANLTGRQVGLYGGGTLINRNADALDQYISVRKRSGHLVPTFGTGVIQPNFWSTREAGWTNRLKEWAAVLAELPVAGVRGPMSKALLDDAGARNVVVCGDPAVSFHRPYSNQPRPARREGPLRVGLNTGDCSGQLWGRAEDVSDSFVALARWLRQSGHQVEIIPVWTRDVEPCLEVARRAQLDRSAVSSVCYAHDAFLERVEKLDLMVCLKLHAGVLAAAANVPFVSVEYQPKCRDFAASLGWEDFVLRTDQLEPGKLIALVESLIAQLDARQQELCRGMCALMHRFDEYCDQIEPLLLNPA